MQENLVFSDSATPLPEDAATRAANHTKNERQKKRKDDEKKRKERRQRKWDQGEESNNDDEYDKDEEGEEEDDDGVEWNDMVNEDEPAGGESSSRWGPFLSMRGRTCPRSRRRRVAPPRPGPQNGRRARKDSAPTRSSRGREGQPLNVLGVQWRRGEPKTSLSPCFDQISPRTYRCAFCSVGRHRTPLALALKKSLVLQSVRQSSASAAPGLSRSGAGAATAPTRQVPPAAATAPMEGQTEKNT